MAKKPSSELLDALDFVHSITKDPAVVSMGDNVLSVVTREMRAYIKISDDHRFMTDLDLYHAAVKTIGDRPYTATINNVLKITAGKFKVDIPIMEQENVIPINPQMVNVAVPPDFIEKLVTASTPTTAGASRVQCAGVYLSAEQTFVGTDGHCLLEVWHGVEGVYHGIIIPTDFINLLERMRKAKRVVTHIAADDKGFAVRYDDDAILFTQLYIERYVAYNDIFEMTKGHAASPDGVPELRAAFKELEPFGLHFHITAGAINCGAASVTTKSDYSWAIRVAHWKMLGDLVHSIDAHLLPNLVFFKGNDLRGCITKVDMDAVTRLGRL